MQIKKIIISLSVIILLSLSFFIIKKNIFAQDLNQKLSGMILIQTEKNGEAWYVNPTNKMRYYMGRPINAFNIMRKLGRGITNNDLLKIQVGYENFGGTDSDSDGLPDLLENSFKTNINSPDSDKDGFGDKEEVLNNHNPNGEGKFNIDSNFSKKNSGYIFLQVEENGEAWYVYPKNLERYFLGRPDDAFNLMKKFGFGISNSDLDKIPIAPDSDLPPDEKIVPVIVRNIPKRGYFMGVLPMPGDNQSIEEGYKQTAQYADYSPIWEQSIGASGFWDYAVNLEDGIFLKKMFNGNNLIPLISFSFLDKNQDGKVILKTPPDIINPTLSNIQWRQKFKKSIIDTVKMTKPQFIVVGNEVNRWYEEYGADPSDPNGFQNFVSLYEEIYDEVKKISPNTSVFPVFAREMVSDLKEADLTVLKMFNPKKMDMLVFTTYPMSFRKDKNGNILANPINKVSDIKNDYYSQAYNYIDMKNKPFGFTEAAWPALDFYGGEEGQEMFLKEITGRLTVEQGINLRILGWPWLHDIDNSDTLGLIKRDNSEKKVFGEWKDLYSQ